MNPKECILYSGSANGAEAEFGRVAERHGVQEVNYGFEGHQMERVRGVRILTTEELELKDVSMTYVSKLMHRNYSTAPIFRKVLQSICWQVTGGQEVFVIGQIMANDTIKGGTGWGAEYAKFCNKPLYVFDQGVLTAFDLATGNVRWRLPSVGIAGMFFDEREMIYLNTTTASPESLKYSRQIDLNQKTASVVMKIDSRTGKTLWSAEPRGLVSYVSGKFIYTVHSYASDQDDDEGEGGYSSDSIMGWHATLSIKRINPGNGHLMWEHCQDRAPCDVQFDKTSIRLVFKKEVQVLRFFSL